MPTYPHAHIPMRAGTRQLSPLVGGFAVLMPPALTLLMQTGLCILISNTETFCASQVSGRGGA